MKNKAPVKNKLRTALWVCAFFAFTVFFFTPSHLYFTNLDNFCFYSQFFPIAVNALLLCLVFILLATPILLSTNDSLFKKLIALIFLCSLLVWFYANILVWQYGLFDGRFINWGRYNYRGIIDILIYLIFVSAFFFRVKTAYDIAKRVSIILLMVQSISLILVSFKKDAPSPQKFFYNNYQLDSKNKYVFSKDKNVIIIVLDSFRTDFFQEIINRNPDFNNKLDGFIYFRNSTGGFPQTDFSTPLILTGKYFDFSLTKTQFIITSFKSASSIPLVLKNNGFYVDIYPEGFFLIDNSCASNSILIPKSGYLPTNTDIFNKDVFFDFIQLYDVALFRISPHFLKKYIYNKRSWFLKRIFSLENINKIFMGNFKKQKNLTGKNDDVHRMFPQSALQDDYARFIEEMYSTSAVHSASPQFKYYHFNGVHQPLFLNENLEYQSQPLPDQKDSYIKNSFALLKLTVLFIEKLKHIGIYDNSMIFILADHGSGEFPASLKEIKDKNYDHCDKLNASLSRGLPLILVKPFQAGGPLKTSDAPASLLDIGTTIFKTLNLEAEKTGRSLLELKEDEKITRYYVTYVNSPKEQDISSKPELDWFSIDGFSWLQSSWKKIGNSSRVPKISSL